MKWRFWYEKKNYYQSNNKLVQELFNREWKSNCYYWKVYARYTEYESIDATGQTKFGHVFEVESIGFVVSPAQNQQNGQTNGGNNNYQHNAPQQSNNNYSNQNQQPVNNQGNFQMFGESEFPF